MEIDNLSLKVDKHPMRVMCHTVSISFMKDEKRYHVPLINVDDAPDAIAALQCAVKDLKIKVNSKIGA